MLRYVSKEFNNNYMADKYITRPVYLLQYKSYVTYLGWGHDILYFVYVYSVAYMSDYNSLLYLFNDKAYILYISGYASNYSLYITYFIFCYFIYHLPFIYDTYFRNSIVTSIIRKPNRHYMQYGCTIIIAHSIRKNP